MIGVAQAVAMLSRRELSAEELVDQCFARIEQREPAVHAWEALDAEGALREARRIDGLLERPPLFGLPVGIKDLIDTAGLPTAYGSPIYRGHVPLADALCVRALRRAGAVILGKTVTSEFAVYTPGKTRNPRDPTRTPGGSSSGSAAAVADGMVPFALGTQTAGSVIRPASFCGTIGWKPTFGVLPMEGVRPMAPSLDTLGFFIPELGDVPVVLSALGAPMRKHDPLEKPVFGLCRTEAWDRAEPTTRAAVEGAAARLELAGAQVREIVLGAPFAGLIETQIAIMGAEAAVSMRRELDERPYDLSQRLREFLEAGRAVTPERLRAAHFQADTCRRELEGLFKGVDALLTPAAVGEAPVGLESTGDPLFNRIWTLLGNPCVSLPVLQGPAGMPLGLQLVGPRGRDETLLAAAEYVMEEFAA